MQWARYENFRSFNTMHGFDVCIMIMENRQFYSFHIFIIDVRMKRNHSALYKLRFSWTGTGCSCMGGFHVTSLPPCWWTTTKDPLMSSFFSSTSNCTLQHYLSLEIGCKPPTIRLHSFRCISSWPMVSRTNQFLLLLKVNKVVKYFHTYLN